MMFAMRVSVGSPETIYAAGLAEGPAAGIIESGALPWLPELKAEQWAKHPEYAAGLPAIHVGHFANS